MDESREAGEGRRHFRPRVKLRWPAEIETANAGASPRVRASTFGVSIGGAFIATDLDLEVGTPLHLWLRPTAAPPGRAPTVLRLAAIVRWRNDAGGRDLPRGFGVEFRALTAADEVALHRHFALPPGATPD